MLVRQFGESGLVAAHALPRLQWLALLPRIPNFVCPAHLLDRPHSAPSTCGRWPKLLKH